MSKREIDHWVLVTIDWKKNEIAYYDSLCYQHLDNIVKVCLFFVFVFYCDIINIMILKYNKQTCIYKYKISL